MKPIECIIVGIALVIAYAAIAAFCYFVEHENDRK